MADDISTLLFGSSLSEFQVGKKQPARRTRFGKLVPRPAPKAPKDGGKARRAKLLRNTVRRSPEVMIKITNKANSAKSMASIKNSVDYISRNGKVKLIDAQGMEYEGRSEVDMAFYEFAYAGEPLEIEARYRQTYNMVLSIKQHEPEKLLDAVTEFAKENLGEEREYLMALHTDTDNPHVHIIFKVADLHGERLHPRKRELQEWRERFADKLLDRGIEANATPRFARGQWLKSEKTAVKWIDDKTREGKGMPSKSLSQQMDDAREGKVDGPWKDKLTKRYHMVKDAYAQLAKEHEGTELGDDIAKFAKDLPIPKTRTEMVHDAIERFEKARQGPALEQPGFDNLDHDERDENRDNDAPKRPKGPRR